MEKERIIKSGAANWASGFGTKGGKLVLTNKTLYFEAHKVNAGKKEFEVRLEDITAVKKGFLNAFTIFSRNGAENFMVNGKSSWIAAIQQAIEDEE